MVNGVYTDKETDIAVKAIQDNLNAVEGVGLDLFSDERVFSRVFSMANNCKEFDGWLSKKACEEHKEGFYNWLKDVAAEYPEKCNGFFLNNQRDKDKIFKFDL